MRFPREFKPKPRNWKVVLTSPIALAALLFPLVAGQVAQAVDESPAPSPSPSASVSPTADPSPSPSVSALPPTADVPRTSLYNTDAASSLHVVVNKKRPGGLLMFLGYCTAACLFVQLAH